LAQPPSMGNRSNGSRWVLACGVGCGALSLLAVLGVIAGFTALRYGLDEAAGEIRIELTRIYTEFQEDEKIPAEHSEVFERIYQAGQRDDASFWTTLMAFIVLPSYLEDGEVTESEAEAAATLADFLEANPDVGLMGFGQFVDEHPEFADAFEDAQRTFEDLESGSDWESETEEEAVSEEISDPENTESI
jgi:hypothetical protein